jgi:hypothetical protein
MRILALIPLLAATLCPAQYIFAGYNKGAAVVGTPTLVQFLGTVGNDANGATAPANSQLWNFDAAGTRVPSSGSLLVVGGTWPNVVTSCTAPCAPGFKDSAGNTLSTIFTEGSGGNCYDGTQNHQISYEQNIPSGLTYVSDTFAQQVNNDAFDYVLFYNIATSGALDTSSCKINITPANNTAPNISGTALTLAASTDLVYVEVDIQSAIQANTVSSITVPSNCTLLNDNWTPSGNRGVAHWAMYCLPNSTSFTPTFTIAQTTHNAFTIMAAAFKAGAGGSAPSAGPSVLLQSQIMVQASAASTKTINLACPSGTTR